MKKIFLKTLLVFVFSLLLTTNYLLPAYAHGGFEKISDNTVVEIIQEPTSPLVGEKVNFSFNLRDTSVVVGNDLSVQNLKNIRVEISVVDTVHGDESKDKTIYKKTFKTDENGNVNFEYTFEKENYFDLELAYKDHNGKTQETGFLVQPRNPNKDKDSNLLVRLVPIIGGVLIGILIGMKIKKNTSQFKTA